MSIPKSKPAEAPNGFLKHVQSADRGRLNAMETTGVINVNRILNGSIQFLKNIYVHKNVPMLNGIDFGEVNCC